MEKVSYKALRSAVVTMDNSVDTQRVYEISANVSLKGSEVGSINDGIVRELSEEKKVLGHFSRNEWEKDKVSYSLQQGDRCAILLAIDAFIAACEDKVINGIDVKVEPRSEEAAEGSIFTDPLNL